MNKTYKLETARENHQLGAARDAFRKVGLMPFVVCAFEQRKYKRLMGGMTLVERTPGDPLHLVCYDCFL